MGLNVYASQTVIPAQAGIQEMMRKYAVLKEILELIRAYSGYVPSIFSWIPACAGMTIGGKK